MFSTKTLTSWSPWSPSIAPKASQLRMVCWQPLETEISAGHTDNQHTAAPQYTLVCCFAKAAACVCGSSLLAYTAHTMHISQIMIFWKVYTSGEAHINFHMSPLQQNFVSSDRIKFRSDYEQVTAMYIRTVLTNITM